MNDSRRQRVINSQLGVRMGDMTAMQTEMMTPKEILAATGGRGVRHPKDVVDPAARKVPDTRGLKVGSTSDDTAQHDANVKGFLAAGGYHHELHTLFLMRSFNESMAGAGGTTKLAIWEMEKYYRAQAGKRSLIPKRLSKKDRALWKSARPRNPHHRAATRKKGIGRGNGVAMRIPPFAHWHALRNESLAPELMLPEIMAHGWTTHADGRASIAAYALAVGIASLINGPTVRRDSSKSYRSVAFEILRWTYDAELTYRHLSLKGARFSDVCKRVIAAAVGCLNSDAPLDAVIDELAGKRTSDALVTVPLALAIFLRHPNDPCTAILKAANVGGDTDTIASMVGALAGANCPGKMFPQDWLDALQDGGRSAEELGGSLHDLAVGRILPVGYDLNELKKELGYL